MRRGKYKMQKNNKRICNQSVEECIGNLVVLSTCYFGKHVDKHGRKFLYLSHEKLSKSATPLMASSKVSGEIWGNPEA
jgi:hypothetical protein